MIIGLAIASLLLSLIPTLMFLANLPRFQIELEHPEQSDEPPESLPSVSILIPARDEEAGIADCVNAARNCVRAKIEILVLDDHSSDSTGAIVSSIAQDDHRVRLLSGASLPAGWNGKQHACFQLAKAASHEYLVFLDADVRLTPDALSFLIAYYQDANVGLLSAFPHQETKTWSEKLLIPMMHFILLGYLPFARMRSHIDPGLAAGCGQLFLTTRETYELVGTHQAIKSSRHDGIKLPRTYRAEGVMTDVIDGSKIATCRMYDGAVEMFRGVLKNAVEGIANPRLIIVFSVLLLGCSLLPLIALAVAIYVQSTAGIVLSCFAVIVAHVPRLVAAVKLNQSFFGALCHVPATSLFVVLQWIALANHMTGRQIAWRGRSA